MLKFSHPAGKLIKSVSVARSDEHVYLLEGGYCNRAGEQLRIPGRYGLTLRGIRTGRSSVTKQLSWPFTPAIPTMLANSR
jgi:hypothetical protein